MKNDKNKQENSIDLIIGPIVWTEARRLRSEGCSLRDISRALNIPTTSIRRVTKDIKLSDDQKAKLLSKKKKAAKKVIRIDYNDENIVIDGKINIKLFKRKRMNNNLEDQIIKLIIDYVKPKL